MKYRIVVFSQKPIQQKKLPLQRQRKSYAGII